MRTFKLFYVKDDMKTLKKFAIVNLLTLGSTAAREGV
jgi:hypothetical protein